MSLHHPGLRRGRVAATVCALTVAATIVAGPATADVDHQKKAVDGKIAATQQDLDDTSAQLLSVDKALTATNQKVAAASRKLTSANASLMSADNHLRDMNSQLAIAKADESENQTELATTSAAESKSKILVGGIARQSYMSGGLGNLQLTLDILTNRGDVTSQLSMADMVMRQQSGVLTTLSSERAAGIAAGDRLGAARRRIALLTIQAQNAQTLAVQAQKSATSAHTVLVSLQRTQTAQQGALAKQKKIELVSLKAEQAESNRLEVLIRKRNLAAALAAKRAAATATRTVTTPSIGMSSGGGVLAAPGPIDSIVSPFGERLNPVLHVWMLHAGDDFPYPCGTPVHAAGAGTVVEAGWDSAGGNTVLIDHGYTHGVNLASYYAHFERPAIVHVGQHVSQGQLIGFSGTTGRSTGCHMHFGVMVNGRWVNPIPWIS